MITDEAIGEALQLYGRASSLVDPNRIELWEELGLTIPQLRVMFFLRREPNAPSGAIAQYLGVTPSTVTGLIDRLVRTGLVRRVEDPADRRMVRNVLTGRGLDAASKLEDSGRAYMADVFRRMDPAQFGHLVKALADLVRAAAEVEEAAALPA